MIKDDEMNEDLIRILDRAWEAVDEFVMEEDGDVEFNEELGDAIAKFHNVVGAFLGKEYCGKFPVTDPEEYTKRKPKSSWFARLLASIRLR